MRFKTTVVSLLLALSMQTLHADRDPVVAGSFYPSSKQELLQEINSAVANAKSFPKEGVQAIIVPHAGYVFSAGVAATSYKTLHKKYKNIFILGSSHHINFDGVSIYNKGDYKTPLGKVHVNRTIVDALIKENNFIGYKEEAHTKEHTIEVQLPFLQSLYGDSLQIVPIVMATSELDTIIKTAKALEPYFNDENLFVISSDLSHYPSYSDAKIVDMRLLHSIESNNPQNFVDAILQNEKAKIPNLQTSACGWSSLLTLLYLTQNKDYKYELLEYKNSGDSQYGKNDKVVGYGSMRIYKEKSFNLGDADKKTLKDIAKLALYDAVLKNERTNIDTKTLDTKLLKHMGAFVTLHLNGKLKGCIGRFEPNEPLYKTIIEMAISASRYDTRFTPVQAEDLKDIEIEISVLTPRKRVSSVEDVLVGRDGIYIEYGKKNGTYLPQVATDMHWNATEFVNSCCEEKAKIPSSDCKKATLYTYEAIIF